MPVEDVASYVEGYADVRVTREGDLLHLSTDYDDNGRVLSDVESLRIEDFLAKGQGSYPWFDLGSRRDGALAILDGLGAGRPAWTVALEPDALQLFEAADRGSDFVATVLERGVPVDALDPCGATALWYAARALEPDAGLLLARAGADANHRIELDALGTAWTTVLHELVRCGRATTVGLVLEHGARADQPDSAGKLPLSQIEADHVGAELVRLLVGAGADVEAGRPLNEAARRLLPATVGELLDRGAAPGDALRGLLAWFSVVATYNRHRVGEVVAVIELLRAGGALVTDADRERAQESGEERIVTALTER